MGKLLRDLCLKILREDFVVELILGRQLGQDFLRPNSHVSMKPLGSGNWPIDTQCSVCFLCTVYVAGPQGRFSRGKDREVEEETNRRKSIPDPRG